MNHTIADERHHDTSISELILDILEVLIVGKATVHVGLCISVLVLRLEKWQSSVCGHHQSAEKYYLKEYNWSTIGDLGLCQNLPDALGVPRSVLVEGVLTVLGMQY